MFIKIQDMKASLAVYNQMIDNGHIEGIRIKEIFTIPAMIKKTVTGCLFQTIHGVVVHRLVEREVKVPNINAERELIGYDVKIISKSSKIEFNINANVKIRFINDMKSDLYGKLFEKHLH